MILGGAQTFAFRAHHDHHRAAYYLLASWQVFNVLRLSEIPLVSFLSYLAYLLCILVGSPIVILHMGKDVTIKEAGRTYSFWGGL